MNTKTRIYLCISLITQLSLYSQPNYDQSKVTKHYNGIIGYTSNPSSGITERLVKTFASGWFDVTYYRLGLEIFTQPNYLKGKITIAGICRESGQSVLTFDLINTLLLDSVFVNGTGTNFIQSAGSFDILLSRPPVSGEQLSVDVYYEGLPASSGFGSFVFGSHQGIPWIYTLSEPYGAKDWWPCKDDPGDKADSADILVTCDSTFKVGSQGILTGVINNGDGTATYHWKEGYPIASYLISIALTNYVQFSNWFRYSETDSMEILNYILPEHEQDARQKLPLVVDMLSIYSELFGLYPFISEKYGHAEFGSGGAMEHQTMTSTTTFDEYTIAHELAHQWFGDMITCRTWHDLWLNEGFAQYCLAIYLERKYGLSSYRIYMQSQFDNAKLASGVIGDPDISVVRKLFDPNLIYSKGASVLHMLRHVLGDSLFFRTMYSYANDPALKYSTATIGDFQNVCERIAGVDLSYFFQEWIYGEGFPHYIYSWIWNSMGDSGNVILNISQNNAMQAPSVYTMPIDIRILSQKGDSTVRIWNDSQEESYIIPYSTKPTSVLLDPDNWILKNAFLNSELFPKEFKLEQNFPNPFNSGTKITYVIPRWERVELKVYDILGREIAVLVNAKQPPGFYTCTWNPKNIAGGIYFYRLFTETAQLQKKMVLVK